MSSNTLESKVIPVLTDNLGLTDLEAQVILPVYIGGNMTVGGISMTTGLKHSKVKSALGRLEKKGLVRVIEGIIPVYQAVSPSLTLIDYLYEHITKVEGIGVQVKKVSEKRRQDIDESSAQVLSSHKEFRESIKTSFEKHENSVLETVSKQLKVVTDVTDEVLTGFSDQIEDVLSGMDLGIDDQLGKELTDLQSELDTGHSKLAQDLDEIKTEFDEWISSERDESSATVEQLETRTIEYLEKARLSIVQALDESEKVLRDTSEVLASHLEKETENVSEALREAITSISDNLEVSSRGMDESITKNYHDLQTAIESLMEESKTLTSEESDLLQKRLTSALEDMSSIGGNVDAWKKEVSSFMETASQSVTAQLEQAEGTQKAYVDVIKTTISGHLEKVKDNVSDEYKQIKTTVRKLGTELDTKVIEAKSSLLKSLQKQFESDKEKLESSHVLLQEELEELTTATVSGLSDQLSVVSKNIDQILSTEAKELVTLTENMDSRLKSAFVSLITTTASKNESVLTDVKQSTHEFETSVAKKLEDVITNFTDTTSGQVSQIRELYDSMNDRLNQRLAESVSKLSSHAAKIQKEIDGSIENQMERIDRHSKGIREEFHIHIEEITSQFITLVQGLEATFNGLLSSQTVEARDLISSAHTEFRNILKTEMASLEDDSLKLQQVYATELGTKIDEVAESAERIRKSLDEFNVTKRHEISEDMATTLATIEETIRGTEESLKQMETGTIKQFGDNLLQLSREFDDSVDGASDTISDTLEKVGKDSELLLTKSTGRIKTSLDSFVTTQSDQKQHTMTDASKELNGLVSALSKSTTETLESIQKSLADSEDESARARSETYTDTMETIDTHRSEVVLAMDAASVWVESAVGNVTSSLDALGTKLSNELTVIQQGLLKAGQDASKTLNDLGIQYAEKMQDSASASLQRLESSAKRSVKEFRGDSQKTIESGFDNLDSIQETTKPVTEKVLTEAVSGTVQKYNTLVGELTTSLSEVETEASRTKDAISTFLQTSISEMSTNRDNAFEKALQSTVVANQYATRKFESIGLDLKSTLSSSSLDLIEKVRNTVSEKTSDITEAVRTSEATTNDEINSLRQERTESLSKLSSDTEKSITRWSSDEKTATEEMESGLGEAVDTIKSDTQKTIETLESMKQADKAIIAGRTETTWHLTGREEICAHILDLANRAEKSIVISVVDYGCLDFKKLSKVSRPRRKVIVAPESEDIEEIEAELPGWRIIQSKRPMMLGLADNKEIVVGGARDSADMMAIVSTDETYLKLFYDILGPRLIRRGSRK